MPSKNQKTKALVLFSGGLDSRLAVKLLQEQGLEVEAVNIKLPFGAGCCSNFACVFNYSQTQGIKLHIIDCTKAHLFQEYLKIIKNPEHGFGSGTNPCKDCKIFLLKQAKKLAKKINAQIIATGEVLGQRPMSQLKHQLELIEKQAGLQGKILRPLSAKLLPETIYEKKGLVNRDKLLNLRGRNRKPQIALAKKYNIKFPSPGGGCLLCEKEYSKKLKDFFKHEKTNKITPEHIQLLNIGRHFRSENKGKLVLGRDEKENNLLEQLNNKLKYNLIIPDFPGPTVLFENKKDKELAENLILTYSKNKELKKDFEKFKV